MSLRLFLLPLALAASVAARFTPRSPETPTVHLHDLASRQAIVSTISQNADGSVPYFDYEKLHLTTQQVQLAQAALKQYFGNQYSQYSNLFSFASYNVTGSTSIPVSYSLAGPGNCKVFPGDAAWPSSNAWLALKLVSLGQLLQPLPQAHVCYSNGTHNAVDSAKCASMAASWTDPFFHLNDPIEMLSALYQGMTCQPPTIFNKTNTCTQGGYPSYVVNITNVAQVQLAVNFARNTGIRLVVKNTGHDFSGKSGGAGSLSIWTHHLKQVAFMPKYKDSSYTGPALKAGVGIQGYELYKAASDMGYIAMGGECPTVGAMGGWIQGGGHSPVSSLFGMGADHALGFELVTADGQFVTANRDHNPDLYWALRGGGGSTFGVVTSVIVRIHKDVPAITAASWSLATGGNVTADVFKAALKSYFSTFPSGADNGIYSYFNIFNFGGAMTWTMAPYFAVNKTQAQAQAVLQPWLDEMKALGAPITPKWQTYNNFYNAYNASFPVEGVNNKGVVTASRMFPRENFADQTLFNATFDEWWSNIEAGMALIGYNIAPTWQRGGSQQTAVNPAWRTGIGYFITGIVQDLTQSGAVLTEQRQNFTDTTMKQWHDLTPTSGAYLNEADRLQPDFQWAFWGSKYPKLLQLKKKYDPKNVFYAWTAVGSEYLTVKSADGYPDENGRVCVNSHPVEYVAQAPDCTQC